MKEEKDVYNLPIAAFTFGKNGQILPFYPIQDLKDASKDNIIKNNESRKNNFSIESKGSKDSNNYSNEDSEKRFSFKNIILKKKESIHKNNSDYTNKNLNININNNNFNNNNFIFIDKEDGNISYIKTVLYSISYMKLLNNYLITEVKFNNKEKLNSKDKLLSIIRDILIKIEQVRNKDTNVNNSIHINNIINIEQLKENLSNLFKDKRKFIKNNPDDPIDFLYVIILFLHSLKIKKENNELTNNICSDDCFSHKYLWIKMLKIYECECKAQSKKILNKNNFFIDIPINIIINKFLKTNIYDMNQNLFIYYKKIISNHIINIDCPNLGNKCKINKVHYKFILKNFPSYLIFNLDNNYFKNNELYYPLKDILKNFILIPHTFNIASLFDIDNKINKNLYELIGIIFLKISKVYTCIFKQNGLFYYYEDNIFINFNNYYDIILFSLKNGLIPISLFYQNLELNLDKNNNNINYELTKEQIIKLEKYVKNTNNLNKNLKNKIRTKENIILDNYIINYTISVHNNNQSLSNNYNNSSRYSGSINSYSSYQKNKYKCNHCERINKIENKICFFCGYDNKPFLINNKKKNIKKQKSLKINSKNIINKKISLTQENNKKLKNNELTEIEDEYKNIDPHVLKYFDMPRPYIPIQKNKEKEKNNSPRQSPKLEKRRIPYNNSINNNFNNNNILKNDKIIISNNKKGIIKINNLENKNKLNNSVQKNIENNLLNRLNHKNSNISHKKINNSDNLLNNNFYSELNNRQLNINFNKNYNIFDFSNKKDLINIEYGKKKDNFTEKKLLKKMNLIKHQKLNKYTIINNNSSGNIANNNLNFNFINNKNISNSDNDLNNVNYGNYLSNKNKNWICTNCLVENGNNLNNCINCKMDRNINNYNSNKYYSTNNANLNNLLKENKENKYKRK